MVGTLVLLQKYSAAGFTALKYRTVAACALFKAWISSSLGPNQTRHFMPTNATQFVCAHDQGMVRSCDCVPYNIWSKQSKCKLLLNSSSSLSGIVILSYMMNQSFPALPPLIKGISQCTFNMHQTMTEKFIHNWGIAYLTTRQSIPRPEQ
jgi:hypothetical protein